MIKIFRTRFQTMSFYLFDLVLREAVNTMLHISHRETQKIINILTKEPFLCLILKVIRYWLTHKKNYVFFFKNNNKKPVQLRESPTCLKKNLYYPPVYRVCVHHSIATKICLYMYSSSGSFDKENIINLVFKMPFIFLSGFNKKYWIIYWLIPFFYLAYMTQTAFSHLSMCINSPIHGIYFASSKKYTSN